MKPCASLNHRKKLYLSVVSSLLAGLAATSVLAQDDVDRQLEEITVTGSRIRVTSGMTTPTPVTSITSSELKDFNPSTTLAAQMDALPQFFDTANAQRGSGGISTNAGGSYLNLRGMGQNRTLVLVDGTRVAPADAQGSVNVDMIPSALTKNIEVVTGGASAAYGADAVAGVVNFKLDREFQGLKASVSTGITEQADGQNYSFSVAGGTSLMDGRLHLIGSVDARQLDQIGPNGQEDRLSNWQDWGLIRNPAWKSATLTPNEPQRLTVPHVFSAITAPQGIIITSSPGFKYTNYTFTDDGTQLRPYAFGDYASISGAGAQNNQVGGQEYKYYKESTQRGPNSYEVYQHSFFGAAKFDLTDNVVLKAQASLGRSESNFLGQTSNIDIPGALYSWKIFSGNPFIPKDLQTEMTRLGLDMIRMTETGAISGPGLINIYDNRGNRSIQQTQMGSFGFDWDIDSNWLLTATYQKGKSTVDTGYLNLPRIDKYFMAMDAVRDPATGKIVCNITLANPSAADLKTFMAGKKLPSPIDPLGVAADSPIGPLNPSECVPFNPFGIGNANQAAKDWILDEEKKAQRVLDQDFAEMLLTGVLYQGWGAGPVSMAAGLTWRKENFDQINTPSFGERGLLNAPALGIRAIPDGFAGAGNRSLHPFTAIGVGGGEKKVWEWYGELNVPIWRWDSGQYIGSTMGYRSSDYSGAGRQESWKIGLDAELLESLRWRFTRSSDIREPNFAEVYLTGTGGGSVQDHFRGNEQNGSLTVLATSNPALGAEKGKTVTTGFVWQPKFSEWIDGLQVSLDWYEINLAGAVAPYGAQRIVDDCFATNNPSVCNLIQRLPALGDGFASGPISRILNQNVNADKAQTRGVDLEVGYRFEPNFFSDQQESFNLRGFLGFLGENSTTTLAGTTQDAAGGMTRPEYKSALTGNYTVGDWGFMLQANYFDKTMYNTNWIEGRDIDDNWIASMTTFNSNVSYRGETAGGVNWRAVFQVTNLLNKEPSIVANASGQSLIASQDALGRRYQISLNMDF